METRSVPSVSERDGQHADAIVEAAGRSAQLATEQGDALLRQYVEQRVDSVIGTDTGSNYYRLRPSC